MHILPLNCTAVPNVVLAESGDQILMEGMELFIYMYNLAHFLRIINTANFIVCCGCVHGCV